MLRTLYGYPTLTLEEAVENYMIQSDNMKRRHFTKLMVTAKWVWLEMLKDTMWNLVHKVVEIDKATHTIKLPCDMLRLMNISVVDKFNRIQSFSHSENMNNLTIKCPPKKCSCQTCGGKDSLCEVMDNTVMLSETIMVNGSPYNKRTFLKRESNGTLNKVIELPYLDTEDNTVKTRTYNELACSLEITRTGCLKPTEANFRLLQEHCECFFPLDFFRHRNARCSPAEQIQDPDNRFGTFKEDAVDKSLMHIYNTHAEYVIISYQPNDQDMIDGEYMVPEFAYNCFSFGMYYHANKFVRVMPRGEKQGAANDFNNATRKLQYFMSPVSVDTIIKSAGFVGKWGGGN